MLSAQPLTVKIAPLFQRLALGADLRCDCPHGQLHIHSQPDDRMIRLDFSNRRTLRYALRSLRGRQRLSLRSLRRLADASGLAVDIRVGERSYFRQEPGRRAIIRPGLLLWQLVGTRFGRSRRGG